jgi:hypothetical protein
MEYVSLTPGTVQNSLSFRFEQYITLLRQEVGMRIKLHNQRLQRRDHLEILDVDGKTILK